MISLAAPHQGTDIANGQPLQYLLPTLFGCYKDNPFALLRPPSCAQLALGSPFLAEIDKRPVPDPIYYTNVSTNNDMWIIPNANAFMKPKCDKKNSSNELLKCNIILQEVCPNHPVDHVALPLDDKVAALALKSLQHLKIDKTALGCP
jgi:hypothetical protein